MSNFRSIITHEFETRKRRNPAYSLRAFAKSMGISAGMLSGILSGKRNVGRITALKIARGLQLPPHKHRKFLDMAVGEKTTLMRQVPASERLMNLDEERTQLIADGHYFALLGLSNLKHNIWDANWIAARLDISPSEAQEAMDRLSRLGMIELEGKRFKQAESAFIAQSPVPSEVIQRGHKRVLDKARDSLSKHSLDERDFSAMTLAISSERMAAAKQCIAKFRDEMYTLLDSDHNDRVYTLAIQFFPTSTKDEQ